MGNRNSAYRHLFKREDRKQTEILTVDFKVSNSLIQFGFTVWNEKTYIRSSGK